MTHQIGDVHTIMNQGNCRCVATYKKQRHGVDLYAELWDGKTAQYIRLLVDGDMQRITKYPLDRFNKTDIHLFFTFAWDDTEKPPGSVTYDSAGIFTTN